jgi:hypothetical protein
MGMAAVRRRSLGGSAIGSALCSWLLGSARLCSPLLASDLGRWDKRQVGGEVVTILTKRGVAGSIPAVPTQVRALRERPKRPCRLSTGASGECSEVATGSVCPA